MKYKVIETISYVNTVEVEAEDKGKARRKAIEGGYMSQFGDCIDVKINKIDVEEVSEDE